MNAAASAPEKVSAAKSGTGGKIAPFVLSFAVMIDSDSIFDSDSPSDSSASRLSFSPGRSRFLAAAFCLACAAALTGIWAIIALPPPIRAGLSALAAWRAWAAISRHALRRGEGARFEIRFPAVELGGDSEAAVRAGGALVVRGGKGKGEDFRGLVEELFLSAPLVVLTAREVLPAGAGAGKRRMVIVAPGDCMDAETHRQFRIRVRRAWSVSAEVLNVQNPDLVDSTSSGAGSVFHFWRWVGRLEWMARERGRKLRWRRSRRREGEGEEEGGK